MTRPYRLGKREASAATNRQRVIEAAAELIVASGFAAVSIEEVADRAGVSRPTVYRAFGSKTGLLEAVAWHVLASAGIERVDAARNQADVADATKAFLHENCRMLAAAGHALRAAVDMARHEPELATIIDTTYYGRRVDSLRQLAGRLSSAGLLRPGWTTESVVDAFMILTSVDTFEVLTRHRGLSWQHVGDHLFAMTTAFIPSSADPLIRIHNDTL